MNNEPDLTRRQFLGKAGAAAAALVAAPALAAKQADLETQADRDLDYFDFLMPRVKFECDERVEDYWSVFPGADRNLLQAFNQVVRCRVKYPPNCSDASPHWGQDYQFNAVVDFRDIKQLRKYPFIFMTAEGHYKFDASRKQNLKQYIEEGGFLLMDDCVYKGGGDYFYLSSFAMLEEVFGQGSVKGIGLDHEVFHNVYDLGNIGLPYMQGVNHGPRGVFVGERLAIFLSSTDLHCGWTDKRGVWFGRRPGHSHKESLQMGVNLIMYALSH
jgi:hypothetical protein